MKNLTWTFVLLIAMLMVSCNPSENFIGSPEYERAVGLMKSNQYNQVKKVASNIIANSNHADDLGHIHYLIGYVYYQEDSLGKAYSSFKDAQNYFIKNDDFLNQSRISNRLGQIFYDLGAYHHSLHYYQKAQNLAKLSNYDQHIANATYNAGRAHQRLGNYEESLKLFLKAREIEQRLQRLKNFLDIQLEIGIVQRLVGNYEIAIQDYWRTINAATGTKYESSIKAKCYNNLGYAYLEMELYDKAKEYLIKSLNYTGRLDSEIAATYNNLGLLCSKTGDFRLASAYFQKSVALNQSHIDLEEVVVTFDEIRTLPDIRSNADSLAYYMNAFSQITIPVLNARKRIKKLDLGYKLLDFENTENQQSNQKTTLIKWVYILIILVLICALVWLFVKYKILPQRRQPMDMQKLDDYISDLKKANKKWDKVIEDHKRFFGIK